MKQSESVVMSAAAAKRTGRNYINHAWETHTDDMCLLYRSVPMVVVDKMLKVPLQKNDYTGVKQVYNPLPARPVNLISMIESLSRVTKEPVEKIAVRILEEERKSVKDFVSGDEYSNDVLEFMAKSKYETNLGKKTFQSLIQNKQEQNATAHYYKGLAKKALTGMGHNVSDNILEEMILSAEAVPQSTQTDWSHFDVIGNPRKPIRMGLTGVFPHDVQGLSNSELIAKGIDVYPGVTFREGNSIGTMTLEGYNPQGIIGQYKHKTAGYIEKVDTSFSGTPESFASSRAPYKKQERQSVLIG
jgi:hypothetical protein